MSCYGKSVDYSDGGLSLQECLTLDLVVMRAESATAGQPAEVTDIKWKGIRRTVAVDGQPVHLSVDVRTHGDPASSVVVGIKVLKGNGTASAVAQNDDLHDRFIDCRVIYCEKCIRMGLFPELINRWTVCLKSQALTFRTWTVGAVLPSGRC